MDFLVALGRITNFRLQRVQNRTYSIKKKLFNKERRKEKPAVTGKRKEKRKLFFKAGWGSWQGFLNQNTTRRVEIFIQNPKGLTLPATREGICVPALPLFSFLFENQSIRFGGLGIYRDANGATRAGPVDWQCGWKGKGAPSE